MAARDPRERALLERITSLEEQDVTNAIIKLVEGKA